MGNSDHGTTHTKRRSHASHINSVLLLFCTTGIGFALKSGPSGQLCGMIEFPKLSICGTADRRVAPDLILEEEISSSELSGNAVDYTA